MDKNSNNVNKYYLPTPSTWPIIGSVGIFCILFGLANWLHNTWFGFFLTLIGFVILIYMIYGWFNAVINEHHMGLTTNEQVSRSFRLGMYWLIFSEAMFFGAFFAALFYVRFFVLPELGNSNSPTHIFLWPNFNYTWPLIQNPNPILFANPQSALISWILPAFNTLILAISGLTITLAYFSFLNHHRKTMLISQLITILLGIVFLVLQIYQYGNAIFEKGLTLSTGIYATTFFLLTGFHALHVLIALIVLSVIFLRSLKEHFTAKHHFAFEASCWYWQFIAIVWLLLFIFVYWL